MSQESILAALPFAGEGEPMTSSQIRDHMARGKCFPAMKVLMRTREVIRIGKGNQSRYIKPVSGKPTPKPDDIIALKVLSAIKSCPGETFTGLSRVLGITRDTIAVRAYRLEKAGIIEIKRHPRRKDKFLFAINDENKSDREVKNHE